VVFVGAETFSEIYITLGLL